MKKTDELAQKIISERTSERLKACCVTGHRDIPAAKADFVEHNLRKEIRSAIDDGYCHFVSGFADGVDLLFALIIAEYKDNHQEIILEAALPYPAWSRKGGAYNALLNKCNFVGVHSPQYNKNCFLIRNHFMVDVCNMVIAVYDGRRRGGTVNTLRYAYALKRDIHIINI